MHVVTTDASSMRKKAYLILLKKKLVKQAREEYDYSSGGTEAIEQYKVYCHLIKKAKNLGEILRVARDMNLNVAEAIQLILYPLVEGIEREDLVDAPETW